MKYGLRETACALAFIGMAIANTAQAQTERYIGIVTAADHFSDQITSGREEFRIAAEILGYNLRFIHCYDKDKINQMKGKFKKGYLFEIDLEGLPTNIEACLDSFVSIENQPIR